MKEKKCECGCVITDGEITELCDRSRAGFALIHIAEKVDGDGRFWAATIMKELENHANTIRNGKKEKKTKIIRSATD